MGRHSHSRRETFRRQRQRRTAAWGVACLAIAAAVIIAAVGWITAWQERVRITADPDTRHAADHALPASSDSPQHPVYRHSIVPGGVHSPDDVSRAIARDPVVADHYHAVTPGRLRVERLPADRLAYVSYRVGSHVYWTRRPMRIPAGETVLTDGSSMIRTRCGNCLSLAPMLPTAEDEPEGVEFDALVDTPDTSQAQTAGVLPSRSLGMGYGASSTGGSAGGGGGGIGAAPGGSVGGAGNGPSGTASTRGGPDGDPDPDVDGDGTSGLHNTADPRLDDPADPSDPLDDPATPNFDPPDGGTGDPPQDPGGVKSVPEPGALLLVGVGMLAAALRRLRSRRNQARVENVVTGS